jgi:hypothetical protein
MPLFKVSTSDSNTHKMITANDLFTLKEKGKIIIIYSIRNTKLKFKNKNS